MTSVDFYDYDWYCAECGNLWYDEEIRIEHQCPTCGCRFCLIWVGPE